MENSSNLPQSKNTSFSDSTSQGRVDDLTNYLSSISTTSENGGESTTVSKENSSWNTLLKQGQVPAGVQEADQSSSKLNPALKFLSKGGFRVVPEDVFANKDYTPELLRQKILDHIAERKQAYHSIINDIDNNNINPLLLTVLVQDLKSQLTDQDLINFVNYEVKKDKKEATTNDIVMMGASLGSFFVPVIGPIVGTALFASTSGYFYMRGREMVKEGTQVTNMEGAWGLVTSEQVEGANLEKAMGYLLQVSVAFETLLAGGTQLMKMFRGSKIPGGTPGVSNINSKQFGKTTITETGTGEFVMTHVDYPGVMSIARYSVAEGKYVLDVFEMGASSGKWVKVNMPKYTVPVPTGATSGTPVKYQIMQEGYNYPRVAQAYGVGQGKTVTDLGNAWQQGWRPNNVKGGELKLLNEKNGTLAGGSELADAGTVFKGTISEIDGHIIILDDLGKEVSRANVDTYRDYDLLQMTIKTKGSAVSGRETIQQTIKYMDEVWEQPIDGFMVNWKNIDNLTDNLDRFNLKYQEYIGKGLTDKLAKETAYWDTFSGKMADELGFKTIHYIDGVKDSNGLFTSIEGVVTK